MKSLLLTATLAAIALASVAPVSAMTKDTGIFAMGDLLNGDFDKRKKPRVKGGSGCGSANDAIEHPECR